MTTIEIAEYAPNEVKQAVTGYGGADKGQMQEMVRLLLGMDRPPRPDDAADAMTRPVAPETLRRWTRATARLCGRPMPEGPPGPVDHLGAAAATLVRDLGWSERARVLVSDEDVPALLRDPEAAELTREERKALATLALAGAIRPFSDGTLHVDERPTAARLLHAARRAARLLLATRGAALLLAARLARRAARRAARLLLRLLRRPSRGASAGDTVGRTSRASRRASSTTATRSSRSTNTTAAGRWPPSTSTGSALTTS